MDTVQDHPLVQAMRLVRDLERRMADRGVADEQHNVIVSLIPKRKLFGLGGRYYAPVKQELTVRFPSCSLMITNGGRIGRYELERTIDGHRCVDKKGRRIGGWFIVNDIGEMTVGELKQINVELLKALAPVA